MRLISKMLQQTAGLLLLVPAMAMAQTGLRVGAAKIDVTPAPDALPANYLGVNDPVFARAIVVDDGNTRAALLTLDAGGIPTPLWQAVSERLDQELNIPAPYLMFTATHTHSVPRAQPPGYIDLIVEAVRQAAQNLQPATMAWGTGLSYININRNMVDPKTGLWREGPNYEGPSDKTVAVLSFNKPDGELIAVYYNYAVHGVIAGQLDEVSGDIPGASSRYIEQSLGNDVVAVWSLGAAGDQNPVFFQQTYDLRKIRIDDYASRGEDISKTMLPGGMGLDRNNPKVQLLMDQQRGMLLTMGQMLGEEVLHVLNENLEVPVSSGSISGRQMSLTLPAGYALTAVGKDRRAPTSPVVRSIFS